MNRRTTHLTAWTLLAALAAAVLAPGALADSRQSNKNNWRNLGYAGAAALGYGLLKHNSTVALLGAGAAGYGAYRYEQDRHSQSQAQRARQRYYYHRLAVNRARYYAPHRYYHRTVRTVRYYRRPAIRREVIVTRYYR